MRVLLEMYFESQFPKREESSQGACAKEIALLGGGYALCRKPDGSLGRTHFSPCDVMKFDVPGKIAAGRSKGVTETSNSCQFSNIFPSELNRTRPSIGSSGELANSVVVRVLLRLAHAKRDRIDGERLSKRLATVRDKRTDKDLTSP